LKATIKATFPSITGAVNVSQAELNYLSGLSSNVQTQLNDKATGVHTHTEDQIVDGNVFPRLAATEVIPGSWNFTTRPQVNGNGVLDTASSIPETQIADGAVFPRIGANETITGNWAFSGTVNVGGLNVGASPVWHSGNFNPASYSLTSHLHTGVYAAASHTHDDRYYTESEVNSLISGFVAASSGQFTIYLRRDNTGGTILASGTAYWQRVGKVVTLRLPDNMYYNTDALQLFLTGLPSQVIPTGLAATSLQQINTVYGVNAGSVVILGLQVLEDQSYLSFSGYSFSAGSSNKGLSGSATITYFVSD
jgi:hypothetical protein